MGKLITEYISRPIIKTAAILIGISMLLYVSAYYLMAIDIEGKATHFAESTKAVIASQPSSETIANSFYQEFIKISHQSFWHEAVIHLSIALLIAAMLLVAVELRVNKLHQFEMEDMRQNVANNIWRAVSRKVVPDKISEQVDKLFHQEFVKSDVVIIHTLEKIPGDFLEKNYKGKESEFILDKVSISCSLTNITKKSRNYDFASNLCSQYPSLNISKDNKITTYPRHCLFSFDGKEIDISKFSNEEIAYEAKNLLPGNEYKVRHDYEQIRRIADIDFYTELRPVCCLTITVHNQVAARLRVEDAYITHPMLTEFERDPLREQRTSEYEFLTWHFDGGLLPGHTSVVIWKEVASGLKTI
jgi:hypothetical protein